MTASKTKMTTKSNAYVYCDVHGKELEERTRDGDWEIVEGFVQLHPYFGPGNTYLLRRARIETPIAKLRAELKQSQHKLAEETEKHAEQERRLRRALAEMETYVASQAMKIITSSEVQKCDKQELVSLSRGVALSISNCANRFRSVLGPDLKEPT